MLARVLARRLFATTSAEPLTKTHAVQGGGAVCSVKLVCETNSKFNSVELELDEAEILKIPLVWLRDHCRSPSNFNWDTNQRRSNATNLFAKSALSQRSDAMEFDRRHQTLSLRWSDGHESIFHTKELLEWAVFTSKDYDDCDSRTYWSRQTMREVPSVSSKNFDFTVFARLFVRFGVVCVTGVDARNDRPTKQLCHDIAPFQETIHGDFWVFGSDEEKSVNIHEVAHGAQFMGPHNDGTYFEQSPGVQVYHSLRMADKQNDIRLVDGFHVAQLLRRERPELFDALATTQIEHHYMQKPPPQRGQQQDEDDDDGDFFQPSYSIEPQAPHKPKLQLYARSITKPVIECFKHKAVQIRFNPYDRAPLRTLRVVEFDEENARANVEKTVLFYEAYERFSQLVHDDNNAVDLTLRPGTVIFIDNTRVMHSFRDKQSLRKVYGCYLSRDGLLAKARPVLSSTFKNV